MRLSSFVARNIRRRPILSALVALTVLGMAIAVSYTVGYAVGYKAGLSGAFERAFPAIQPKRQWDLIVQAARGKQHASSVLLESLRPKIAAIRGVKQVDGGLLDMVGLPDLDTAGGVLVQGWPPASHLFDYLEMVQGERLVEGDHGKVLLGTILARNLDKKVGDEVTLYDRRFQVKGIYGAHIVYENGGMVILLEDLQEASDRKGQVNGFTVFLERPEDKQERERVKREIEALGKNIVATPTWEPFF